jgi:tetratricopeptide (TPR) repeat protein
MSDGKVFPFSRRLPDPGRAAEFAATARRLQREREASTGVVELLLVTPREQWEGLAGKPEMRTCGALERLGNFVAQALGREPRQALAVAELAVSIAEAMPSDAYPQPVVPQLRAHAWKDLGKALLYLGRFAEALAAVERAEAALAGFGALAHDRAIVLVVRAATLQEVDRHDESFAVLAECKAVFRDHGDRRRLLLCGIAEGVLLHRLRKYREAREAYLLLLAGSPMDDEAAACLQNAIGHCSVDLGDHAAAQVHLSRAIEMFHHLGQPLQAAKAELGRGRMFVRTGQTGRGIAHLRAIRSEFLRHGMTEEAGLCGLEIVEALLVRRSAPEAETLARQIIAEFTAAALNTRAITALGYLSEAIAARKASAQMVTGVREYILSLRTFPEREFTPVPSAPVRGAG